jgi:hypothetical protein
MVEATVDARRRGLCPPDYVTNKSTFARPPDDLIRKDCKENVRNI